LDVWFRSGLRPTFSTNSDVLLADVIRYWPSRRATGILPVLEHGQDVHGTPPVAALPLCATRRGTAMAATCLKDSLSLDATSQCMYTSHEHWAGAVMPLSKPLVELPAAIEANLSHRMATNETRESTIASSAVLISGCLKERARALGSLAAGGHDMYEKAGSYAKRCQIGRKPMLLIIKSLLVDLKSGAGKSGELNIPEGPTML
jgi:hypothetical protein